MPDAADMRVWMDPSSRFMRLTMASAKNPMEWLFGDQNGNDAPSVPANGRAVGESSNRSHN